MKGPRALGRLDTHLGDLLRGASRAFVVKGLGAALTVVFSVVLTRRVGVDAAGVFFLALNVATLAALLARVGLDNSVLRFVGAYAGTGEWGRVRRAHRDAVIIALVGSLAAVAALFLGAPLLAQAVFARPDLEVPLRWMGLAVLPLALVVLYAQSLRGLRRVGESALLELQGVIMAMVGLLGLVLFVRGPDPSEAVRAYVFAAAATAALGVALWARQARGLPAARAASEYPVLLASALPLLWVNLTNFVLSWAGSLLLGRFGTAEDLAAFNVATRVATLTSFVLFAVNAIAAPKFAALHQRGERQALVSTARQATLLATVAAAPILVFLVSVPGWVMGWFGPELAGHGPVLAVLALGQFVNVATGSVGHLLMMTGHERPLRNAVLLAAVLNVALGLALVLPLGALGAAIAAAVSLAVKNLLTSYLVYNRLGIRMHGRSPAAEPPSGVRDG